MEPLSSNAVFTPSQSWIPHAYPHLPAHGATWPCPGHRRVSASGSPSSCCGCLPARGGCGFLLPPKETKSCMVSTSTLQQTLMPSLQSHSQTIVANNSNKERGVIALPVHVLLLSWLCFLFPANLFPPPLIYGCYLPVMTASAHEPLTQKVHC